MAEALLANCKHTMGQKTDIFSMLFLLPTNNAAPCQGCVHCMSELQHHITCIADVSRVQVCPSNAGTFESGKLLRYKAI